MKRKLNIQGKENLPSNNKNSEQIKMLVEIQTNIFVHKYGATCFDVKQLQKILRVGESNVYQLLRSGKLPCQTIGRRKVVSVAALAQFLVVGA